MLVSALFRCRFRQLSHSCCCCMSFRSALLHSRLLLLVFASISCLVSLCVSLAINLPTGSHHPEHLLSQCTSKSMPVYFCVSSQSWRSPSRLSLTDPVFMAQSPLPFTSLSSLTEAVPLSSRQSFALLNALRPMCVCFVGSVLHVSRCLCRIVRIGATSC